MRELRWQIPLAIATILVLSCWGLPQFILTLAALNLGYRLRRRLLRPRSCVRLLLGASHFLWDFMWDLTLSNLILAWDVLTPKDYHQVSLLEIPVEDLVGWEIALLSHRITLTPGTLTCDLSEDGSVLIVHSMYLDEDKTRKLRHPIQILRRLHRDE